MTIKYKDYTITYTTSTFPDGTVKNYTVIYSPPMPYKIMKEYEIFKKDKKC